MKSLAFLLATAFTVLFGTAVADICVATVTETQIFTEGPFEATSTTVVKGSKTHTVSGLSTTTITKTIPVTTTTHYKYTNTVPAATVTKTTLVTISTKTVFESCPPVDVTKCSSVLRTTTILDQSATTLFDSTTTVTQTSNPTVYLSKVYSTYTTTSGSPPTTKAITKTITTTTRTVTTTSTSTVSKTTGLTTTSGTSTVLHTKYQTAPHAPAVTFTLFSLQLVNFSHTLDGSTITLQGNGIDDFQLASMQNTSTQRWYIDTTNSNALINIDTGFVATEYCEDCNDTPEYYAAGAPTNEDWDDNTYLEGPFNATAVCGKPIVLVNGAFQWTPQDNGEGTLLVDDGSGTGATFLVVGPTAGL